MSRIDAQLTEQIERALRAERFDDPHPDSPEALTDLFASISEYLAQPMPPEIRALATEVAQLSTSSPPLGDANEEQFRSTLASLRKAIECQRAEEVAANQLASDPELVEQFLIEGREHLAGVETGILLLEREPYNAEALNAVFRCFHSVKGLAGFFGATGIHELAHDTETVLDLVRGGKIRLSSAITDLILRAADELNQCLDRARTEKLNTLGRCDPRLLAEIAAAAQSDGPPYVESGREVTGNEAAINRELAAGTDGGDITVTRAAFENSVVRIETSKLEYLIDMVGELVIAESVIRHDPAITGSQDPLLSRNLTQMARVVQEVQKTSMSMRMVAVGTLFRKMSRLTRDLARRSGKTVELILLGEDVELDRSIVEELADPMVHMIRNAVDHGLEERAERHRTGKAEKGTVRLQAMYDAGDVVIEIADDGRGMDPGRILAKAKRIGLVREQETPDEQAIFRLIFEPGFSTLDKITELSGRGVGMDVVKAKIQKLRGRIAIRSTLGQGSTFTLRLPLTLAIIDGLVVGVGSQRFILPMFAVREMFSPKPETFVTVENRAEAALFRDKLLPVIRLSRLFEAQTEDRPGGVLIVAEGRDQLYCIAVDQLIGKQEVVIKSLGKTFRDVPGISGGAILGDGRVGLIIDVNSLRYQS